MRLLDLTTIFLSLSSALANVEKVIFIPPPRPHPLQLTHAPSSLFRLSPGNPRLSTALDLGTNIIITSPSDGRGEAGSESWVVLEQLIPGKRYEVRIVWAATEPAEFELGVFTEVEAVEAGAGGGKVIRSEEVVEEEENSGEGERGVRARRRSSSETVMYLRILAIKDRYNPDPVTVELILDPFLWNILPESLLYIGGVIVLVAGAAWWVSGGVEGWLSMIARQQRVVGGKKVD